MSLLAWVLRALVAVPKLAEIIHEIVDAIAEQRRDSQHGSNRDAIDRWLLNSKTEQDPGASGEGEDTSVEQ